MHSIAFREQTLEHCKPKLLDSRPEAQTRRSPKTMDKTPEQRPIFEYLDYREFIADFYRAKKGKAGTKYSLSIIAKKAGISRMAVQHLVAGTRHLSLDKAHSIASALQLKTKEKDYFENLIRFNKAKNSRDKQQWFKAMMKSKESPILDMLLSDSQMGVFKDWFYPVIAEMSYLEGFEASPEWVQPRLGLKVRKKDIVEALSYLEAHHFLNKRKGTYLASPELKSQIYKRYCMIQSEKLADAIAVLPSQEREWETLTIAVSNSNANKAKFMIRNFSKELRRTLAEEADTNKPQKDQVLQINLGLWAAAKSNE